MKETVKDFAYISAKDLARILPFRAMSDVRYYLNGVYVEPVAGGAVIVATNGHILAASFSGGSHVAEPVLLETSNAFAAAVKAAARTDGQARMIGKDSPIEVFNGSGLATYVKPGKPAIDGKFPDWRAVIPSDDKLLPGLPHAYNAKYLQMAIDAICDGPAINRYGTLLQAHHVKNEKNDFGSAAVLRADANFICVVMPVAADKVVAIPPWAAKIAAAKAA